jgi:hypothetical protein
MQDVIRNARQIIRDFANYKQALTIAVIRIGRHGGFADTSFSRERQL